MSLKRKVIESAKVGINEIEIIAVNPNNDELRELGWEAKETEPKYVNTITDKETGEEVRIAKVSIVFRYVGSKKLFSVDLLKLYEQKLTTTAGDTFYINRLGHTCKGTSLEEALPLYEEWCEEKGVVETDTTTFRPMLSGEFEVKTLIGYLFERGQYLDNEDPVWIDKIWEDDFQIFKDVLVDKDRPIKLKVLLGARGYKVKDDTGSEETKYVLDLYTKAYEARVGDIKKALAKDASKGYGWKTLYPLDLKTMPLDVFVANLTIDKPSHNSDGEDA